MITDSIRLSRKVVDEVTSAGRSTTSHDLCHDVVALIRANQELEKNFLELIRIIEIDHGYDLSIVDGEIKGIFKPDQI